MDIKEHSYLTDYFKNRGFDYVEYLCKREDASFMNIVEYSVDGTRINEHYGMVGKAYRKDS